MATLRKVPARDWDFGIYDDEELEYKDIAGLTSFEYAPEKESAETTDFDSEGWSEHIPVARGVTLSFDGQYVEGEEGERDAGQELVEELGDKIGPEGFTTIKMSSPFGGKEVYLEGSIEVDTIGGDTNDSTSWGFEFEVNGKPKTEDPHAS